MVCCVISSLSQHHGMTYQSHGSREITRSKQGFAQPNTNFQLRRCGPTREELHSSVSLALSFQAALRCPITSYSHVTLLPWVY